MERRFLIFAGALTVVAIAMGAGLILLARDKVNANGDHSKIETPLFIAAVKTVKNVFSPRMEKNHFAATVSSA